MILFVQDDGKWKVVNLTNINDFLIAMTSFLKSDKSTRGEGTEPSAIAGVGFWTLSNYNRGGETDSKVVL